MRQFKGFMHLDWFFTNGSYISGALTGRLIPSAGHKVSNASRYNPGGKNEAKPLVAEDVYLYLAGTGLLYAGVSSC